MKNTMTYAQALTIAIETIDDGAVIDRLRSLRESLAKRSSRSDESKEKANAKRKEKTAKERAALMEQVLPVLRGSLTQTDGLTAKELYEACADNLPADFTSAKVQYVLLHEMADEVEKIEAKNKPNVYKMKG